LIAEDEALIRLDLREMLQEEGYEVVGEAGDGEMAVTLAQKLLEVTRRIRGPLHAAVRAAAVDMHYTPLPGPSRPAAAPTGST